MTIVDTALSIVSFVTSWPAAQVTSLFQMIVAMARLKSDDVLV
jgi:hypothetical protein